MSRSIVVDLFAGGGGASVGIEAALGRPVDLAINHSPIALAVHKLNHPTTRHLEADIWEVHPREATGGRQVGLLWASPDCTHFSVAKGDVPRDQGIRSLAWVVVDWAREVRPSVVCIENVREFQSWGPLCDAGRPIKKLAGTEFARWVSALEGLGYVVEWRVLDAATFGAPTRRKRLFVVARCDGLPIRWPAPSHGPGLLPERTAAEIIDWSLPCPSIFERSRPLAEKTLARIAEGLRRYVFDAAEPFVVNLSHGGRVEGIAEPLRTITAHPKGGDRALVAAFLSKHFGGVVGHDLHRPVGAVTARDHHALTTAALSPSGGDREPRVEQVRAFLTTYYGSGSVGQRLTEPARTITAKHRLGLVTVHGVEYQVTDIGMRMLEPHELLAAQFGRFAPTYRMDATKRDRWGHERPLSKADRVRLIGNSVCPEVAERLVAANTAELAREAGAA